MQINLTAWQEAFSNLPQGIREAEINCESIDQLSLHIQNAAQTSCTAFQQSQLYVKANGEHTGLACTEQIDEDPYQLLSKAYDNSRCLADHIPEPITAGQSFHEETEVTAGREEMICLGSKLEKAALSINGVEEVTCCQISRVIRAVQVLNSRGLNRYHENVYYTVELSVRLSRKHRRSHEGFYFMCKSSRYTTSAEHIPLRREFPMAEDFC